MIFSLLFFIAICIVEVARFMVQSHSSPSAHLGGKSLGIIHSLPHNSNPSCCMTLLERASVVSIFFIANRRKLRCPNACFITRRAGTTSAQSKNLSGWCALLTPRVPVPPRQPQRRRRRWRRRHPQRRSRRPRLPLTTRQRPPAPLRTAMGRQTLLLRSDETTAKLTVVLFHHPYKESEVPPI